MPYLNAGRSVAQIDTLGDTARFEGTITRESAARLIAILDAAAPPKRLVMSSGGGDSNAAKEIGDVLARRHIELEVVGLCASACAGFVLPAAPAVVLNGIVIFHGSSGACVRQLGLIGMGLQSGFDTTLQVWRQGQFDNRFWRKYPAVRHWVELSGTLSRGDPSGQPNDWLLVRPAALIGGGLRAVQGAHYEQREAAIFALRKVHPDLVGSMFVRDRL